MRYPFHIRIKDPEISKIMAQLEQNRTSTINGNKNALRKLSYKISPIREDIFIGFDWKTRNSNISIINPFLKVQQKENTCKKKYKDYIFHL